MTGAAAFAARRAPDWQKLADLCERPWHPRPGQARELAALYRAALADLGLLRTLCAREQPRAEPEILRWLNTLVARAHALVYVNRRVARVDLGGFFARELPAAIRRALPRLALATALLLGSAAVSYFIGRQEVGLARVLAGPAMSRNAEAFAEMGRGRAESTDAVMTAFYVTNNVQVSFVAFALGITFGLGTLWVLVQNGFAMGITLALVGHYGSLANFLAFISAHAPVELFAILLAAAAGLGLGQALVAPGPHTRVVALKLAAVDAAKVVMGAACLLLLAAFIEGFFSPSSLPATVKHATGLTLAALLVLYVWLAPGAPGAPRAPASSSAG
jgi:uncharacterized membrane protein SpoIIM required for sporulation